MSDEIELLRVTVRHLEGERANLRRVVKSAQQQIEQWRQLYEQESARVCALLLEKDRETV